MPETTGQFLKKLRRGSPNKLLAKEAAFQKGGQVGILSPSLLCQSPTTQQQQDL